MQNVNSLTVLRIKGNSKALQLSDQEWYSTYSPMETPPAVGSTVSFQYDTKEYNGATFRNIKSTIQVTGSAPASSGNTVGGSSNPAAASGGYKGDPVIQRSIIRQNAMRHAVSIVDMSNTAAELGNMGSVKVTEEAITIAAKIEEYTSGREDSTPAEEPDFNDAIPPAFKG